MAKHAQLVVLGGGPGGYPAAFAAADHGMEVVLVDEGKQPGGVCLNRGCIPSKALLHVAKLINESKESADWGITFQPPEIDLDKLRDFKEGVVGSLCGGIEGLCKQRGVELIKARGTFKDSSTLELKSADGTTSELTFDKAIVAIGSIPTMPGFFNIGDDRVMDSTGALKLQDIPEKLLVVGGGYIGLEMGSVYAALGSEVTVVEMSPGLLPGADRDLVTPLQKRLKEHFAAIHTNTKVASLTASDAGIVAALEGEGVDPEMTFDRVLISIGRRPNSANCGLENTGVEIDERGFIKVDRNMRTADPKLMAIGDIAGEPMLAHKATREARIAVETLLGEPVVFDNIAIPAVVFTDPEVAWAGITETEAKAQGIEHTAHRFPWAASGRAQTLARTEGVTKIIVEPKHGRVLGIGICGAGAGEMIAEAVVAIEMGATARDLADSIHAHPTLSETVMEAAESVLGQPTHFYRKPRRS
ncbi:MAG: dihydrolipoyl dehydrogenase [Planctomycetaceae bacterium]|nr:dihydrolipoyl dehydrogenase [Planctomycetaceae bacterium]